MRIKARIITNSKKFGVKIEGGELVIKVKSPPEKGRANAEITKELEKILERRVRIVKGYKSPKKVIEIEGDEDILQKLRD